MAWMASISCYCSTAPSTDISSYSCFILTQGGGFYCGTKAAVKTITEGLRQEVSVDVYGRVLNGLWCTDLAGCTM